MAGGPTQSSSSSGIFFQGDGESQDFITRSHLNSSYGNSTNSGPGSGPGYHNLSMVSGGEMNNPMMNCVSTSGPSIGASSLVTDANSGLSGGHQLQRSSSINTESYMRLPASPMSFSSNNISISGSSVVDGSTVIQHNSSVPQGGSCATSLPTLQNGQIPLSVGPHASESFFQDPNNLTRVQKRARIDMNQDDILQQQVLRQWLQRQDMLQQQQGQNPQFQILLQQQRLRQQQQLLQSLPPLQRHQLQQQQQQLQQQQQQQLQMRQQGMQQQLSGLARPYENSVCARRLMQYLYHQRQRPSDNSIVYWRKFVAEYYSPRAKKKCCLSLYDNVGHQTTGVFPQASMDAWRCDICGSKSGRGFEATFDIMPRLNEIKFASGVLDELLYLGVPCERRAPSGIMILEYGKAVQENVYEHLRVVREGQLRIIFSQELKILSWEFCARRHEELLPRRLVAPQVNQLLQIAHKCQNTLSECASSGVLQQEDLRANGNLVVAAGCHLARSIESHSLNDLGFSKRYVRCLQISEVVNSMKDLIDLCRDQSVGPLEALKKYPMMKMDRLESSRGGLGTDRNSFNQMMINNTQNTLTSGRGALSGPGQTAFALTNYQTMLMRHNSMNSNPNSAIQQSPSSSQQKSFQGRNGLLPGSSMQNPPINSSYISAHQHNTPGASSSSCSNNGLAQSNSHQTSIYSNQAMEQQQMIHQLLQQLSNSNNGGGTGQQQPQQNMVGTGVGHNSGSNGFKAIANDEASLAADSNSNMAPNMSQEFSTNDFFNSDVDDNNNNNNMGYGWKA